MKTPNHSDTPVQSNATPAASPTSDTELGVKPAVYGESERPPRGDYRTARADYTCEQRWEDYTPEQHELYRRLYARQANLIPGHACSAFLRAVKQLDAHQEIPRFDTISAQLRRATGWEIVAVPGLIPEAAFFSLLAARRFPVTVWLREPEEFDYIVEPDLFHDLFGHVPLLFNPAVADYMQAFGQGGLKADGQDALEFLARLYWYTVEFGLIAEPEGLRIYGAGILSSAGEVPYSLHSPVPRRKVFDLMQVMRTRYKIDTYQATYFVVDSFESLMTMTSVDFQPIYPQLRKLPILDPMQD